MNTYIIDQKHNLVNNTSDGDILITATNKADFVLELDSTSISKKPWIISLNNISGQNKINLLSKNTQSMVVFLNGTKEATIRITIKEHTSLLNIVFISENDYHEQVTLVLDLNLASNLSLSLLANNLNYTKQFDLKILHNEKNIYSTVKALGINGKGTLTFKANTVISNEGGGCSQNLRIINLSEDVCSECDPVLTILNNNIEYARHGATVGGFNQDNIFYLQSKGINLKQAKKLLLNSSIRKIIKILKDEKTENFIASQFLMKSFVYDN